MTYEVAAYDRRHPQAPSEPEDEPFWDYRCGFVDERTVIASTGESDEKYGQPTRWSARSPGRSARP
ncbi:hypothetical protein [Micromonospora sp. NPDC050200]|uniref:hypothetical protein n=1 Tax=Micromonospora sp. NPDC050200 TaxID=3155664 RepID=UPI0033CF64E7